MRSRDASPGGARADDIPSRGPKPSAPASVLTSPLPESPSLAEALPPELLQMIVQRAPTGRCVRGIIPVKVNYNFCGKFDIAARTRGTSSPQMVNLN